LYRQNLIAIVAIISCAACSTAKNDFVSLQDDHTQTVSWSEAGPDQLVRDDTIEVIGQNGAPALEGHILDLVNRQRASAGIKPLTFSTELAKAARQHSGAMAEKGFFEHRGEGEPALFDRVDASGLATNHVGENIFATTESAPNGIADQCVQMWMRSEGHRKNMMSREFEKTGIAIRTAPDGENYVTEDFAE